jgi:DnaJ-domain-containing protein 1
VLLAFLLGAATLLIIVLLLRAYAAADPRQLLGRLKWLLLALAGGVIIGLAAARQFSLATFLAFAAVPVFKHLFDAGRAARLRTRMAGAPSGQTSQVETRFLRMALQHDSGDLDGEIIDGDHAGRRLSDLALSDLLDLLLRYRQLDPASAQVLEAYLDRQHNGWRDEMQGSADSGGGDAIPPEPASMTREQACQILGVEPGASEAAIRDAHRRLIALVHPDRGGSGFLAAQVNQARDILLGSTSHRR